MIDRTELIEILARIYKSKDPTYLAVAKVCDDFIDPSGALLGEVRDKVIDG